MKLFTKLTLFITLSKMAIVILFVLLLPQLVNNIAFGYTNYYLKEQEKKVIDVINRNGIDYYLQGESNYGSYTMLKEEYISLELTGRNSIADTLFTSHRLVEGDTLNYRILNHVFDFGDKKYMLEIGKTTASIDQYNRPLQRVVLYVLIGLIALTILIDLVFTRLLLRPLGIIIKTKLVNRKFPFKEHLPPVKTSTADFKYLDQSLIDLMGKIKVAFEKEREFTSNASHELMTPISILQSKIENLMVDNELNEELQEKISGMMKTLTRLKKIVHSLLFISRIENDQFSKLDQVIPGVLIAEVMEELADRVEARGLHFSVNTSREVILMNLNHDLIFQLVYNLINNAIRYNRDEGDITITDHFIPGESYVLFIKDSGVGIPEDELETIFDRFKKSRRTEGEGYGLGLSIVQSIAQYHGLKIAVASKAGKGATFSIIFPGNMV